MPQASDGLRALIQKWFSRGDPQWLVNSDYFASQFLLTRGWTEQAGMWHKPTPSHTPSIYEEACLVFLRDEWDYDFEKPLYSGFDYTTGEEIK